MRIWNGLQAEIREVVWLASIISGLSLLGVGLGVVVALALDGGSLAAAFGPHLIAPFLVAKL